MLFGGRGDWPVGSQVLLEKQGSTTTATYTYGNGLIRKDSEYPLYDGLGSVRTVTNGSQMVTGTCLYNDFGQVVASTGSTGSAYQFAATSGYRTDGDAGLMKVGARYYDAQVGRFITRDTYLDQHPYLYCGHDPINSTDPSGHMRLPRWLQNGLVWIGLGGSMLTPAPPGSPTLPSGENLPEIVTEDPTKRKKKGEIGGNDDPNLGNEIAIGVIITVIAIGVIFAPEVTLPILVFA